MEGTREHSLADLDRLEEFNFFEDEAEEDEERRERSDPKPLEDFDILDEGLSAPLKPTEAPRHQ